MARLTKFLQGLFQPPRYPPRYDLASGHAVISYSSFYRSYWLDDTRYRARCASAPK